jgi:hypothetical protein
MALVCANSFAGDSSILVTLLGRSMPLTACGMRSQLAHAAGCVACKSFYPEFIQHATSDCLSLLMFEVSVAAGLVAAALDFWLTLCNHMSDACIPQSSRSGVIVTGQAVAAVRTHFCFDCSSVVGWFAAGWHVARVGIANMSVAPATE